jgi:rhodanese-related sulfurtransferase
MKKLDKIIIGILILGGVISIFLNDMLPYPHIKSPQELVYAINQEGRYVTTDDVAKMIMEKDPSLLLIDIRSPQDYEKYTLEGAINIPADSLMNPSNRDYVDQDVYTTVLFSNGSSAADEAWLMLKSYGFEGNKVMKGGLNEWYRTILKPIKPADQELTGELKKQYLFRKGAQIYFTGAQIIGNTAPKKKKSPSKPIVKRKKKEVSGGCG